MRMNDSDLMPWGDHKGRRMDQLPPNYALWLLEQPWLKESWPKIHSYLAARKAQFEKELGDVDPGDGVADPMTYEDYLEDYRGF